MANYPLLIKGFYENPNGTGNSIMIAPGGRVTWNQTIIENRGNMIAVDAVLTGDNAGVISFTPLDPCGLWSLSIGGMRVIANSLLNEIAANARPRSYEILPLNQKGGQTLQLDLANQHATDNLGAIVHVYHHNPYATEQIVQARKTRSLKQRVITTVERFVGGQRIQRGTPLTVPTASGNIVALELICYQETNTDTCLFNSTVTVWVDGTSIIEEAASVLFNPMSGRPALIFPILIRPGATIQLEVNTLASTNAEFLHVALKAYFDNDDSGTREYATND